MRVTSLLGLLLAGCSTAPLSPAESAAPPAVVAAAGTSTVYVARRTWHVDVGFATTELEPPLASLVATRPEARYWFFGFGDRRYLMREHHNAFDLIAALFPGDGLVLATTLTAAPEEAFGTDGVAHISLSAVQAHALQAFVWQTLSTSSGSAGPPQTGPYEGSYYFPASMHYSALHTCNTWVAEALRAAGLPIRASGVVFAGQLWTQVRALESPSIAGAAQPAAAAPR
jgi:hypothetical protein